MAADQKGRNSTEDSDVLGQGDERAVAGHLGLRRAVVAGAVLLGVVAVSRSGLLSSGEPTGKPPPPSAAASSRADGSPRLVARIGTSTLMVSGLGIGKTSDALPKDLEFDAPLLSTEVGAATAHPLVGVADGRLFRSDPSRDRWRPLGRAETVVATLADPSRIYVIRGGHLVETDTATGRTTDRDPFPGFVQSRWHVEGVLTVARGEDALVLSRPVADGRADLALAWSAAVVQSLGRPSLQPLGTYGPVLGIAADRVITLQGCPGPGCRVVIVSRTNDLVLARSVEPPPGWTFLEGPSAGREHEALVTVARRTTGRADRQLALARLVPGGDSALLVGGTEGFNLDAGLVDGPHGQVYLLVDPVDGTFPEARVWDPNRSARATLVVPRATFPPGSELVCVCG